MCESKVFLGDKIVKEDAVRIRVEGEKVKIWDIVGDVVEIGGRIVEIDLLTHKIVLGGEK